MTHTKYALQDTMYDWCACVCVCMRSLGVPRIAYTAVFTTVLSPWWGPTGYLYSTDPSHQLSHHGAPSVQSVGSWRGKGCRPRGQRERKGGETHE